MAFRTLLLSSLMLVLSLAAGAQDMVYRNGASYHSGNAVNSYTNAGAVQYRRTMRSRGGVHYNVPQYQPRTKSLRKFKIPKVFSYTESAYQTLPKRFITVYDTQRVGQRKIRTPRRLNLSEVIEKEAKRNNLDPLLVEILIHHESNFRPYAVSRTGAQGLMQLMPGTANMLGVDDSFDVEQNVAGGTRYLAEQLARFKNLGHALAAYNAGPGAVKRFGGVPPYAETQNYVASIAASYASKQKKKD